MASSQQSVTGDINILLLGPTGVGKTTFINAFANYLVYNTLDEAIVGDLQAIIPAWFTFMDRDTYEDRTIIIGTPDESEAKGNVGQSCTRQCRSFVFRIGHRNLRLIDAPGVGDTQGLLQDEKNFEDILAYIAQYEYLNGICILLKPSEERLHIMFRFCVKELLRHLHVHAKQNIMFVFTNARATQFQPGPAAPILRDLLRSLRDHSNTEVPFSRDNSFLFDNEAFRFLALCKNGIEYTESEQQDYTKSWNNTIKEFSRLISRIMKCDKHATRDTLSLNEAQQLIRKLARPIGEISRLIQENLQLAQQYRNDVLADDTSTAQYILQKDAKVVPLGHPRTVCTHDTCIKTITVNGQQKVEYATHCHSRCLLIGVEQEVIGHEKIKFCNVMDRKLLYVCKKCQCSWEKHMHITYEFQDFMVNVKVNMVNDTSSPLDVAEKLIVDLKHEKDQITKVCAQLSQFLQANALNPVNDDILQYIEHFIREEKIKKNAGAQNDDVIAGLQSQLDDYRNEMAVYRENAQTPSNKTNSDLTAIGQPEDMFLLVGTLYRLPINGPKIRAQIEQLKLVQERFSCNREQTVNLPLETCSTAVMKSLQSILSPTK